MLRLRLHNGSNARTYQIRFSDKRSFQVIAVQFHILDRNGKKPPQIESGLKDPVLVQGDEVVRIIMTFPEYSDVKTPYMYHCHIL